MPRNLRRSVVVLSALAICVASGGPGTVSAKTTRIPVAGEALFEAFDVIEERLDKAGGWHARLLFTWDFSLYGDDNIDIQGSLTSDMRGYVDDVVSVDGGNGVLSGTFVVQQQDEVIWKGRLHGSLVAWKITAVATARGKGPFEGMLLQLVMEESNPPFGDDLDLTGWVLDVGR